jgi:hypothetical protein
MTTDCGGFGFGFCSSLQSKISRSTAISLAEQLKSTRQPLFLSYYNAQRSQEARPIYFLLISEHRPSISYHPLYGL